MKVKEIIEIIKEHYFSSPDKDVEGEGEGEGEGKSTSISKLDLCASVSFGCIYRCLSFVINFYLPMHYLIMCR